MEPRFTNVVFLHGKGEMPTGAVAQLEDILKRLYPDVQFARPFIPDIPTDEAFALVKRFLPAIRPGSLLIGLGRGGLLAARLQREFPALNFHVFDINAPTMDGSLSAGLFRNRCVVYSSLYEPIANRCGWGSLAPLAFDLDWLRTGKNHFYPISYLISGYMQGNDMIKAVSVLFPTPTP